MQCEVAIVSGTVRRAVLVACVGLALGGCQAFGNLTTGAMTTTNRAVGQPPAGPASAAPAAAPAATPGS